MSDIEARYWGEKHRAWMREALTTLDEADLRTVLRVVLDEDFARIVGAHGIELVPARLFGAISSAYERKTGKAWEGSDQADDMRQVDIKAGQRKGTISFSWVPSDAVLDALERFRLDGETKEACADRLIANSLQIAYGRANYEEHFGKQSPTEQVEENEEGVQLSWRPSKAAKKAVRALRLKPETNEDCAERLISNLLVFYSREEYAEHFGEQTPVQLS